MRQKLFVGMVTTAVTIIFAEYSKGLRKVLAVAGMLMGLVILIIMLQMAVILSVLMK